MLRWFSHLKRRGENSIIRRVMGLEMEGRRPVGRPSKVVEEDTRKLKLNITEDMAADRK